jgi:aldehyde dehydrogenase (NAD+)
MTHVNDHSVYDAPTGPHGGERKSSLGRFGGEWIIHEFAADHWVTFNIRDHSIPFEPRDSALR